MHISSSLLYIPILFFSSIINFDERKYFELLEKKIANSNPKSNQNSENLFDKAYKKKWTTNW